MTGSGCKLTVEMLNVFLTLKETFVPCFIYNEPNLIHNDCNSIDVSNGSPLFLKDDLTHPSNILILQKGYSFQVFLGYFQ